MNRRSIASATRVPPLPAGTYVYTAQQVGAVTANILGNNTLRVVPWIIEHPTTIVRLAGDIAVVGEAGSKLRIVLYADNGFTYPGALVVDAGQIAADSATVQELTVAISLAPGVYWPGGIVQSAPTTQPTLRAVTTTWTPPVHLQLGTSLPAAAGNTLGYQATGQSGAAPATFPATVAPSGLAPRIIARTA